MIQCCDMTGSTDRNVTLRSQQSAPPRATEGVPFVGRTIERAQMAASLDQVAAGDSLFVSITGEAGVGKTRLVVDALERSGQPAHWARCNKGSNDPAFWPLLQHLRSLRLPCLSGWCETPVVIRDNRQGEN